MHCLECFYIFCEALLQIGGLLQRIGECFFYEAESYFQSGQRPFLYCTFPRTVSGPPLQYSKATVKLSQALFMYSAAAFAAQPRKWFPKCSIISKNAYTIGIKEWGCIFKVMDQRRLDFSAVNHHHTDSLDQVAGFWAPRLVLLVIDNVITWQLLTIVCLLAPFQ